MVSPLVANLTDDNADGSIDLCDTPDVLAFLTGTGSEPQGTFFILDGQSGAVMAASVHDDLGTYVERAIGDIDGDGRPEILVPSTSKATSLAGQLRAYKADGTRAWQSRSVVFEQGTSSPSRTPSAWAMPPHATNIH